MWMWNPKAISLPHDLVTFSWTHDLSNLSYFKIIDFLPFHMAPRLPKFHNVLCRCHFHVRSWPHCWPQFKVNGSAIPTKSHFTIEGMYNTSLREKSKILLLIGQIWKITGSRKGDKVTRQKNGLGGGSFTFLLDAPSYALIISYITFLIRWTVAEIKHTLYLNISENLKICMTHITWPLWSRLKIQWDVVVHLF